MILWMPWCFGHFCQLQHQDVLLSNPVPLPHSFLTLPPHPYCLEQLYFMVLFQSGPHFPEASQIIP